MSATATISKTIEVLRDEVRAVGAIITDAAIIDRRGRAEFMVGRWQVQSCQRHLRFKHWKLILKPLD